MKQAYLTRLQQGVLLFDGAMGTLLFDKGIYLKKCFEETNLTNPQLILDTHREYLEAGARALETNTFGANPVKLATYNLAHKTQEINRRGVELAKEAAEALEEKVFIAGSVGPSGLPFEPQDPQIVKQAQESFQAHLEALIGAGVDLILLETFLDRREMELAIQIFQAMGASVPLQAQFTLPREILGDPQLLGAEVEAWGRFLDQQAVDVIGLNHLGPTDALEALQTLRIFTKKPVVLMPDYGYPREVDGRQFYLTQPDYFAENAKLYLDAGACAVGGCCGTTPQHIRRMGEAVISFDRGRRNLSLPRAESQAQPKPPIPLQERSSLGRDLAQGNWVSTVELVSPIGTDLSRVLDKARKLEEAGVKYINIPDGPRASSRISALITSMEIARETSIEPIFHMCTRDKNLIGLQGDLLGSEAVGLRNILMITGDPPKVGKYPSVTGVFDVDSVGLLSMGAKLNQALDLGSNEIPSPTGFVLGTGVNPSFPVPEKELERAWQKVESGAEYFITQPVWDLESLVPFLEKLSETRIPILLGLWPLANYRNALFLANEVPGVVIPEDVVQRMAALEDKEASRKEGIRISLEILEQVRPLVAGIQVSPPFGNIKTALEVVEGANPS